jgi:antirestriction protein ArdC
LCRHSQAKPSTTPRNDGQALGSPAGIGHKLRLDRDLKTRFESQAYAAEELVAELGAAFLCAEFGFDGDVRNAGYIASWIELLKGDKRAFFTACSKAAKAAEYLRGLALAEPIAA